MNRAATPCNRQAARPVAAKADAWQFSNLKVTNVK